VNGLIPGSQLEKQRSYNFGFLDGHEIERGSAYDFLQIVSENLFHVAGGIRVAAFTVDLPYPIRHADGDIPETLLAFGQFVLRPFAIRYVRGGQDGKRLVGLFPDRRDTRQIPAIILEKQIDVYFKGYDDISGEGVFEISSECAQMIFGDMIENIMTVLEFEIPFVSIMIRIYYRAFVIENYDYIGYMIDYGAPHSFMQGNMGGNPVFGHYIGFFIHVTVLLLQ
jgi:hypothetical protein